MKNPSKISVNDLAKVSNLTPRRIRQLATDGKLPRIVGSELPWQESLQMLFEHYQKLPEELTAERLALAKANRAAKEHDLAKEQRRYIERRAAQITLNSMLKSYHTIVKDAATRLFDAQQSKELIRLVETKCEELSKVGEQKIESEAT